jgi:tripartite-type tricarboxylate transporter receptor subunit TctC
VPALLGGHVDVAFSAYPSLSGAIETKRVTLLANNAAQRSAQAPDIPPVADYVPGFDFAPIIGLLARSGTPQAIIRQIAAEAVTLVKEPDMIRQFAVAGIEPVGAGPEDYGRALKDEVARVADVVKVAGITPQ